jgi:solute carrier family 50 (sugar transporter)
VIKKASIGEFSCIPYILTLFSSLMYMWYSFPVVSSGWENLTLSIINIIGVLFETVFISIYLWYAPREKNVGIV